MMPTIAVVADNEDSLIAAIRAIPMMGGISAPTRFNVDETKCCWGFTTASFIPTTESGPGTQEQLDTLCVAYGDNHLQQFLITDPATRNYWKAEVLPTAWEDPDE